MVLFKLIHAFFFSYYAFFIFIVSLIGINYKLVKVRLTDLDLSI